MRNQIDVIHIVGMVLLTFALGGMQIADAENEGSGTYFKAGH